MDTVELTRYSLGFAFQILEQITADLTQEQADWMPPGIANPIGALYWHIVSYVDMLVHDWGMGGKVPLRDSAGWKDRVVLTAPPPDEDDPMGELRAVRQGLQEDLAALHDYAKATSKVLLEWVASLTPEDMDRPVQTTIGELSLAQMLDAYIIWHINVHCGEIAALKGSQGLPGYPW